MGITWNDKPKPPRKYRSRTGGPSSNGGCSFSLVALAAAMSASGWMVSSWIR